MRNRTVYRHCSHCKKRRPIESFHGTRHQQRTCRVCSKLYNARLNGREDVAAVIRAYGDLDHKLHNSLGAQWPYTLVKAAQGRYTGHAHV